MKVVICVLLACLVAMAYAQIGSSGGLSAASSSMSSTGLRGGNFQQMLLMAALNGNDNARIMLTCSYMNIPTFLCMQQMA